jgi:hypothetical protein
MEKLTPFLNVESTQVEEWSKLKMFLSTTTASYLAAPKDSWWNVRDVTHGSIVVV